MFDKIEEVLTLPGNGVFTVNTAKNKKENLFQAYYNTTDVKEAEKKWKKSLKKKSDVLLLGVPSDCGAGIQRGSNWGPLAIREHLIKNKENRFLDLGDIRVVPHLLHDKYLNEKTIKSVKKALYNNSEASLPVSPLSLLEYVSKRVFEKGKHLLSLGGDHSISYPLVKEWLIANQNKKVGVLHFDAHTDLLEERLGIDYCFGSWATHALNYLKDKESFVQVGIRSSGKDKDFWENKFGLKQIWSEEVLTKGAGQIGKEIREHFERKGVDLIYVSFDIDTFDIEYASATGTPESGGIDPSQALMILDEITRSVKIQSADLVEVAPNVFYEDRSFKGVEPLTTLESALAVSKFFLDHWYNER